MDNNQNNQVNNDQINNNQNSQANNGQINNNQSNQVNSGQINNNQNNQVNSGQINNNQNMNNNINQNNGQNIVPPGNNLSMNMDNNINQVNQPNVVPPINNNNMNYRTDTSKNSKSFLIGIFVVIALIAIVAIVLLKFMPFTNKSSSNEPVNNTNNNSSISDQKIKNADLNGYWISEGEDAVFSIETSLTASVTDKSLSLLTEEGMIMTTSFTYDEKNIKADDTVIPYKIENNILTLSINGKDYRFKPTKDENKFQEIGEKIMNKSLSGLHDYYSNSDNNDDSTSEIYDKNILGTWVSSDKSVKIKFEDKDGLIANVMFTDNSNSNYMCSVDMDATEISLYNHNTYKYVLNGDSLKLTNTSTNVPVDFSRFN